VCERYPGDGIEQLIYRRVLARYRLGAKSEARQALGEAIDSLPMVAKEPTKARHRRPKDMRPDHIIVGGEDQTYCYWIEYGCYWKNTPGATDLVRESYQKDPEQARVGQVAHLAISCMSQAR
jgi:hypothetical protein